MSTTTPTPTPTPTPSTMPYLYLALTPLLLLLYWVTTAFLVSSSFPVPPALTNARIVLLIAHPDDEAMFFAPSLLALTEPGLGNHVKILCLSSGDADGLGETRKGELRESAVRLGVRRREDVYVVEDSRFKDGMHEDWNAAEIAGVLAEAFSPVTVSTTAGKNGVKKGEEDKPSATIDVLLTFDGYGVSAHPNHRALSKGAQLWTRNLMKRKSGWRCPVQIWCLSSVNIVRKYCGVLDAVVTMAVGAGEAVWEGLVGRNKGKEKGETGAGRVLCVSGLGGYWKARAAMVEGHKSQMVWFRWGWITIGRYMVVSDLKRVR